MASVTVALDTIYNIVCLSFGVDIKDKTQRYGIPMARYYFVWLSDYFINTSRCQSEYSKCIYDITKIKRGYRIVIADYFGFTHAHVCKCLKIADGYMETDREFCSLIEKLKEEINSNL